MANYGVPHSDHCRRPSTNTLSGTGASNPGGTARLFAAISARRSSNGPPVGSQPVRYLGPFLVVKQVAGLRDVFAAQLDRGAPIQFRLLFPARGAVGAEELVGECFDSDTAPGSAERPDPVEEQVLRVGR